MRSGRASRPARASQAAPLRGVGEPPPSERRDDSDHALPARCARRDLRDDCLLFVVGRRTRTSPHAQPAPSSSTAVTMLLAVTVSALNFRPDRAPAGRSSRSSPTTSATTGPTSRTCRPSSPSGAARTSCGRLRATRSGSSSGRNDAVAEQKARDRLELLRNIGTEELTPTLREWGCDEALNKIRNRRWRWSSGRRQARRRR